VTVVSPLAASYIDRTATDAGTVADMAASRKREKYSCLSSMYLTLHYFTVQYSALHSHICVTMSLLQGAAQSAAVVMALVVVVVVVAVVVVVVAVATSSQSFSVVVVAGVSCGCC